jgi:hypothetical protein
MKEDFELYRAIDVWRRVNDEILICYRCFEVLSAYPEEAGFCVQSADHYYKTRLTQNGDQFDKQYLELLTEQKPNERSKVFSSLRQAIHAFKKDFED